MFAPSVLTAADISCVCCSAENGGLRAEPTRYTLPGVVIALIHDIAVTPDYYVIAVGPIDFSLSKFVTQYMTSRCSIAECMEYKPSEKPTNVHLVPRPNGKAGKHSKVAHASVHVNLQVGVRSSLALVQLRSRKPS